MKDFKVHEFGVSVPFQGTSSVMDSVMERIRKQRDACLDWHTAFTFHSIDHNVYGEPSPTCYFCSWSYKFWSFWQQIDWWASTCNGCGQVMYACNYSCDFWEDY